MKEKNVSNLTKTLAVVSLLAPVTAQPLGIGDIELHSALNQKLNAEIRLHLAAGENPADINVRLAPPEKFDQAGVPWNYFLSKIKFTQAVQADGSVVVKVTSKETLTEPFLDFLLEVSWPQGSLFREFTLLIDPPTEYQTPVISTADSSSFRDEALEEYDRPVRKSRSSARRKAHSESNITPQTATSGEYGPIQPQDTLWHIAERLGSERNVPTKQMLNALFNANPAAFNHGDMDSLKTGAVLKIPESEAILQGVANTTSQSTTQKTARKDIPATPKAEKPSTKALELVAPTESKIADNAVVGGQAKSGTAATGAPVAAPGDSTADGKDLELQAKIEKLEQQLGMMQQLLALKDQQLATLQSKDKTAPSPQTPPSAREPEQKPATTQQPVASQQPTSAAPSPAVQQPGSETPPPVAKPKTDKPPVTPKPSVQAESDSSTVYYMTVGGIGGSIIGFLGWLWLRNRKIEEQTNTESMFASASQIKMPDTDSTLSVPVMEMSSAATYDVGTVGESSFISDFTPSDFDAFDTDQSEVDPMSEADVYLAYGRYQQAEDLIRNAIKDQPDRDEYKLKLLEILYANENKERFAAYAQELADAGKQADRPFWSKVSDMGKEIVPESILFGGTVATLENQPSDTETSPISELIPTSSQAQFDVKEAPSTDELNLNDDLIDLNAPTLPDLGLMDNINSELAELQLTGENKEQPRADDNGLDFDLSSFSEPSTSEQDESPVAATDIESIDFDLSSLSLESANTDNKSSSVKEKTETSLESFDFNFDIEAPDFESNKSPASDKDGTDEPLDLASLENFEFPEFETTASKKQPTSEDFESVILESIDTSDDFDFNFDFEAPTSDSGDKNAVDDLGVSDLTDMDEFETKIDLAKAYTDMGDIETAKKIAEEVLEKGNKEQKLAAQAILDELG